MRAWDWEVRGERMSEVDASSEPGSTSVYSACTGKTSRVKDACP